MSSHRRPQGRHRSRTPSTDRTPSVVSAVVFGAAAAALATAATSEDGLRALTANVSAAPLPTTGNMAARCTSGPAASVPGRSRTRPAGHLHRHRTLAAPARFRSTGRLHRPGGQVDDEAPYAFTYGIWHPCSVVSGGLTRATTQDELIAVLHHESDPGAPPRPVADLGPWQGDVRARGLQDVLAVRVSPAPSRAPRLHGRRRLHLRQRPDGAVLRLPADGATEPTALAHRTELASAIFEWIEGAGGVLPRMRREWPRPARWRTSTASNSPSSGQRCN